MDAVLELVESVDRGVGYVLLALAAAVEYVFPPFPGDTVVLFGAFLAATAQYSPFIVYAVLTLGSGVGGMGAYAFGRHFDDESRWPRWLQTPRAHTAFGVLKERFDRYGPTYLLINRFLPAMRAFFFVAAGVVRMSALRVALYGGLSAAIWNALLIGVGYAVGNNWERLVELSRQYSLITSLLVVVAVVVVVVRWQRRRARITDSGSDPSE